MDVLLLVIKYNSKCNLLLKTMICHINNYQIRYKKYKSRTQNVKNLLWLINILGNSKIYRN